MQCKPVLDFFLGALSPCGFSGWFAEAAADDQITPWLIKAGPGCGKSTLMRLLLERDAAVCRRDGSWMERIHCSSDPDSLDGVRMSDVGALVLDATAPHTLDCKFPDAAERLIPLYDALDHRDLARNRKEILQIGHDHAQLMQQASAHWALASAVLIRRRSLAASLLDQKKLRQFTARLAARTMPARRGAAPGKQYHRLLSAPTPKGLLVFSQTVLQLAHTTLYAVHDPYGAASSLIMAQLADHARKNGYDAYLCHCASDQRNKLDHLFIPSLGLGFVTNNPWHPMNFEGQKNIHAARFAAEQPVPRIKRLMLYQKKLAFSLLEKTCESQAAAKTLHDALEQYYVRASDFTVVDRIRKDVEREIFEL